MSSVLARRIFVAPSPRLPLKKYGLEKVSTYTRTRTHNPVFSLTRTPIRHISSTPIVMDESEAKGESTGSTDGWKTKPPYSIHENIGSENSNFKTIYEANCHCERVKYQLSRDAPLDSKLCHCTTCQTQHAAPFQWAAIFHKTDINFTSGHHNLEWYDPTSKSIRHKLPCKVRCSYCHSPIMDEGRNMILLFPSLIHLKTEEAKKKFKPKCHMFYGQRVVDMPDGLPKWDGINNDSNLIEDSPPELVKEMERKNEEHRSKRQKNGEDNDGKGHDLRSQN